MDKKPKKGFSKQFMRRVYLVILVMLVVAVIGILYRIVEYVLLLRSTNQHAVLNVAIVQAAAEPQNEEIVLPGTVSAWHAATIYARTNGYVVKWMVDIGAHVKAGDLLAIIATPEVDAQLRQTEADLITAVANYNLAHTTSVRWQNLLKTDSVSKQETEEKISDEKAKAAIVNATRANRDRLRDLVSFERVVAPFDGVIMSRTTDIGRLINAGNGTVPLFRLVQSNPLRVYVQVPEYYASSIAPDLTVQLYFAEHPGKVYTAKLLDTAKAINSSTRTLLVQFKMENPDEEIFSGSYTQAHLILPSHKDHVILPVNTLVFRAHGTEVATIDGDSKALLKPIIIGRDYGDTIEVVSGLTPGESVIVNPPDSLFSGEEVTIVPSYTNTQDVKKA